MIKKMDLQHIIYICIIALMILIPAFKIGYFILLYLRQVNDFFVLTQAYLLWGFIPILFLTYIVGLIKKKIKFNYIDIIIYFLIIFAFISTHFAVNKDISIYGEVFRNEGLLTLINYYLVFLNARALTNIKYKKNIIKVFIIIGLIQVFYGILQVYTPINFIKRPERAYMASGFCDNPNFYGSLMVMLSLITSVYYLIKKKQIFLILSIIFFVGLCLSNSTAPFIGFVLAYIFALIINKSNKKTIFILSASLILTFFLVDFTNSFRQEKILKNKVEPDYVIKKDITNILKQDRPLGNGRMYIWKNAIPVAKNFWITGSGIDTFARVFPQDGIMIYDKAHNIYLQMLITNGLYPLIAYLLLCFILFIKGFKFKRVEEKSLYIAFVGYSIQAFANISVITVAPYFFIILGLLYSYKEKEV
ncbi:MAG: O-antigen ligase family protein [Bacilli bacterium]